MPSANESLPSLSRAFVRSLNLLLKFARLYGLEHTRTASQLNAAWVELNTALNTSGPSGLVLGTSGTDLLVDGMTLESTASERSLAQLLTNANIASIVFTHELTREAFTTFVRAFAEAGLKPTELVRNLKSSFGEGPASGIRINEIRFVAADSDMADSAIAAQLAAKSLGVDASKLQDWLRDPEKLIQLISAAEGSGLSATSGYAFGEELIGTAHEANSAQGQGVYMLSEQDMQSLMQMVTSLNAASHGPAGEAEKTNWKERFATLPAPAQATLRETLARISSKHPNQKLDDAAMLQLAEDMAIHYAIERFQRGDLKVDAVRQLLDKLGKEIETLRKVLASHEDKMAKAGMSIEMHADILDRQFWSSVSESGKRGVLLSPESWCVPARNVRQYCEELLSHGDSGTAEKILTQYAGCVSHHDPEARKKAAMGLSQMVDLYVRADGARLDEAVRLIGEQLSVERDAELQSLLSAAFVRFSQEAAERKSYPAVRHTLDTLAKIEKSRPNWSQSLEPRIGIANRIPEFIDHGLNSAGATPELLEVLRRVPEAAADQMSSRLMRVARGVEREQLVRMARALGEPAKEHLRRTLEYSPITNAVRVVGLLSRIEPSSVEQLLPERIRSGERSAHDEALRQLSVGGAPERGRMLMGMIERLDRMIVPMALDEVGMSGDPSVAPELLRLAEGDLLPDSSEFLRVKAIEALGRLRPPDCATHLRQIIETRHAWRWAYPTEMRLAAGQALMKLDPEQAQEVLARSGLDAGMLSLAPLDARLDRDFVRFRRYPRIRMTKPVSAVIQSKRGKYQPAVQVLSLEGGLLSGDVQLSVGTAADLRISSGMRPIRLEVLVRFTKTNQAGVEMVGMDLEDRSRLRSLLVSMAGATPEPQPLPMSA